MADPNAPRPTLRPRRDRRGRATLIAAGGIVAVPTETVYGLAADATDAAAVARIYAAKGRPSFNPLIVHVLDLAAAERLAVFDDDARALAAAFWPGPLTLVLPVRDGRGDRRAGDGGADDGRDPRAGAPRDARRCWRRAGRPLAAPSANRSDGISPTRAAHVAASLGDGGAADPRRRRLPGGGGVDDRRRARRCCGRGRSRRR